MGDSTKLISLDSILSYIRTHLPADPVTVNKIIIPSETVSVTLGSSVASTVSVYGNTTNKVAIAAKNITDNKTYSLLAKSNRVTLYDGTDTVYSLYPTSGTSPISVSNGVVSISAASTTAAGSMSAADKTKLNSLPSSISGTTPISVSNAGVVSISAATTSAAGSMSAADKAKLNKISVSTDGFYVGSISSNANTMSLYGNWDDASIGDYINISYYKADGLEASRFNVGEDGIRFRSYDRASTDVSFTNTLVWDINPKTVVTSASTPLSISSHNITISAATTSAAGSMSAADKKKLNQILVNSDTIQFYVGNAQVNNKTFGIWQNAGSALAIQGANETLDSSARVYFTSIGMPSSTAQADYISLSNFSTGSGSTQWRMFIPHYIKICRTSNGTLSAGNPRRFTGSLSEYKSSTGSSNYFQVTSDGGIKVLKTGTYRVSGSTGRIVAESGSGPITFRGTYLTKNYTTFDSSTFNENKLAEATTHDADEVIVAGPNIVHLAADEVVRLWGRQVGGGTATWAAVTAKEASAIWICVELISIDL